MRLLLANPVSTSKGLPAMYSEAQIAALMKAVRETATDAYVAEISEHFAGYYDELGITITVLPGTANRDIEALSQRVSNTLRNHRVGFGWILMIERAGRQVSVAASDEC